MRYTMSKDCRTVLLQMEDGAGKNFDSILMEIKHKWHLSNNGEPSRLLSPIVDGKLYAVIED